MNKKIQKENFKCLVSLAWTERKHNQKPYIEEMDLYHQIASVNCVGLISRRQFKCLRKILGTSKVEWLNKHLDEKEERIERRERDEEKQNIQEGFR